MEKILIPSEEMRFFNLVSIDEVGEVFEWNNRIFRGVTKESKNLVDTYFSSGFIDEIVSKGLFPKTEISNFYNPKYCYIVEHERIGQQSIDAEWSFDMLKDAAILVSQIAAIAWRYGFNMKDCHTKNVLFLRNKPIYVDLGSFVEKVEGTNGFRSYEQIMGYYYYTLKLWADGCISLPKQLQSLYKFEKRDYMLYKHPLWRHLNSVVDIIISLETKMVMLTCMDNSSERIRNSRQLLLLWKMLNNINIFKWQKPNTFAKMFINIKTPKHLEAVKEDEKTIIINNESDIFQRGNKTIIINPNSYGFLDEYLKKYPQKEIVTIDINESAGNANYLKYRDGKFNLTNFSFNMFYPTLHHNYQTPPTERYYGDSFIIVNPNKVACELRKPLFVLFRLLLQYSFEQLIVIEEINKCMNNTSKEIIEQWYMNRTTVHNGFFILSEYQKR